MTVHTDRAPAPRETEPRAPADPARLYQEGMVAGVIGAAVVALWFFVVDLVSGRPLFTPTVLGTALFRQGAGLARPDTLAVSLEMVAMFTWVHGLVFVGIGGVAARLLGFAERNASFGFGILLLFVVFQFGFMAAAMVLAGTLLQVLAWPLVFAANLLATAAMAGYFWLRHPTLRVTP